MQEKKDDEHIENPDNSLTSDSSEDIIIKSVKNETDNKSEIESMEVHHHAHHPNGHKKTWKSYITVFFMLFLAVFCGYLAEYQLEHKLESDREKVFMQSLVADIKRDTSSYNWLVGAIESQNKAYESLGLLLSNHSEVPDSLQKIVVLTRQLNGTYRTTTPSTGTITQLNAGGLRLIKSEKVIDQIDQYYDNLTELNLVKDRIIKNSELLQSKNNNVFNYYLGLDAIPNESDTAFINKHLMENAQKISFNKNLKDFQELGNLYFTHAEIHAYYAYLADAQKYYAVELLKAIHDEYGFE